MAARTGEARVLIAGGALLALIAGVHYLQAHDAGGGRIIDPAGRAGTLLGRPSDEAGTGPTGAAPSTRARASRGS